LVAAGVFALWRPSAEGPTATDADSLAAEADSEAARAASFDLLVDFRDDIGPDTLAATPWLEEALSAETAVDKLYRIRFDNEADARRAAEELRKNPAVESVDWDVPAMAFDDPAKLEGDEAAADDETAEDSAETLAPGEGVVAPLANDRPSVSCAPGSASPDHKGFPDDPCFVYQWHMRQIGLPGAWKLGQGKGVIVAVIDTGVSRVPDLAGTEFVPGYNFVANNTDASDDHGHGTHVAGTIAQATHNNLGTVGVAFGAKIMPLKVLSASGSGSMGAIAQAIRWAADHGAKVINMSLGGPFPVGTIRSAVKYARDKGVVVVCAAGNDGRGRVSYPAKYAESFAVAATQFDETTTFYSNWGKDIDISAPGGNVRVDQNGDGKPDGVLQNTVVPGDIGRTDYLWFMGTSMASPHVAGVAALLVGAGVNTPEAVERLMRETARRPKGVKDSAADGRIDDHFGAGIVDAAAALEKARLGRGASELSLAGALALVGLAGLRRRGRLGRLGLGLPVGIVAGASGLFFLPFLFELPSALAFLGGGVTEAVPATFAGFGAQSPLLLSAALPFAAVALLAGVPRLRGLVGGLAFGVAGALAFLALSGITGVSFVPDFLDRTWLALNAAACVVLGRAVLLRKVS
jgi:serine protease